MILYALLALVMMALQVYAVSVFDGGCTFATGMLLYLADLILLMLSGRK